MALTNGLVVMTPTSSDAVGTGSSTTINTDGSTTFSACTSFSLNGVFTSSYDNYMVTMRYSPSSGTGNVLRARLRLSGTDATSTADYNHQRFSGDSTITATRTINEGLWRVGFSSANSSARSSVTMYLFCPQLSTPTAYRSLGVDSWNTNTLVNFAGTHELSTSYDGITFSVNASSITGLVTVFGFNQ